jgi:hypothetical protein
MKTVVWSALIASALVVAACGGGGGGAQPTTPAASVQVGPLEDGSTVNLAIGQTLGVAIANAHSSNLAVLQPAGAASGRSDYTLFRGVLAGEVEVTGEIRPACPRNAACPAWVREFKIGVIVGVPAPGSPSAQITEAADQTTYTMKVGQTVEVSLRAAPGYTDWQSLSSTDQRVLAPLANPAGAVGKGVTAGSFRAVSPGTAQITANSGLACSPAAGKAVACPLLARVFTVTVTVVAA